VPPEPWREIAGPGGTLFRPSKITFFFFCSHVWNESRNLWSSHNPGPPEKSGPGGKHPRPPPPSTRAWVPHNMCVCHYHANCSIQHNVHCKKYLHKIFCSINFCVKIPKIPSKASMPAKIFVWNLNFFYAINFKSRSRHWWFTWYFRYFYTKISIKQNFV